MRREWLPTCSKEAVRLSHAAFHEDDMFADLPKIAAKLTERGYSESDAEKILGGNWLRFLREHLPA